MENVVLKILLKREKWLKYRQFILPTSMSVIGNYILDCLDAYYKRFDKVDDIDIGKFQTWVLFSAPVDKHTELRAVFADTAMKTGEQNDYTVFLDAVLLRTGKILILNVWRKKVDAVGLLAMAKDIWSSVSVNNGRESLPPASALYIEDKASGTGWIQQLQKNDQFVPVIAVQRTKDKLTRMMEVQPRIQAGAVMLPEYAPWVVDFVSECEAFTANDSHKNDDQIDPLIDAVNTFLAGASWSVWS